MKPASCKTLEVAVTNYEDAVNNNAPHEKLQEAETEAPGRASSWQLCLAIRYCFLSTLGVFYAVSFFQIRKLSDGSCSTLAASQVGMCGGSKKDIECQPYPKSVVNDPCHVNPSN
jgi:hypothetical protein